MKVLKTWVMAQTEQPVVQQDNNLMVIKKGCSKMLYPYIFAYARKMNKKYFV